jgi:hypothetical protein
VIFRVCPDRRLLIRDRVLLPFGGMRRYSAARVRTAGVCCLNDDASMRHLPQRGHHGLAALECQWSQKKWRGPDPSAAEREQRHDGERERASLSVLRLVPAAFLGLTAAEELDVNRGIAVGLRSGDPTWRTAWLSA